MPLIEEKDKDKFRFSTEFFSIPFPIDEDYEYEGKVHRLVKEKNPADLTERKIIVDFKISLGPTKEDIREKNKFDEMLKTS